MKIIILLILTAITSGALAQQKDVDWTPYRTYQTNTDYIKDQKMILCPITNVSDNNITTVEVNYYTVTSATVTYYFPYLLISRYADGVAYEHAWSTSCEHDRTQPTSFRCSLPNGEQQELVIDLNGQWTLGSVQIDCTRPS